MADFHYFSSSRAGRSADELIFLHPEQIRLQQRGDPPKAEQNRIIRLSASIRRYGIIEPLCVRAGADENGRPLYELTDGERRLRAACLCGLTRIPCRIVRPDAAETAKLTILQRLQTEKADIFTQAENSLVLMREYGMTQEEISRKLGLSQSAVANKIRLLQFSPEERARMVRAGLCERHARALLRVHDGAARRMLLESVIRDACTVSATETRVEAYLTAQKPAVAPQPAPFAAPEPPKKAVLPAGQATNAGENPTGVHKFAVRDLRPLYNSIDRTLAIFRKTGAQVERTNRETPEGAEIVIRITRQG